MKFGPRRPSLRKRVAARTSWKRVVRHSMGVKAPRGWGWLTNPRKAAYNRRYNRMTFSLFPRRRRRSGGCMIPIIVFCGGMSALCAMYLA